MIGRGLAIVRRELIAYFSSPLAWIVAAAFLFLQGYVFWLIVTFLNDPRVEAMLPLRMFFGGTIFFWLFLLFVVPTVTMRLIAEERRSGTLEVLMTSPVGEGTVVLAKYAAALLFYLVLWLPTVAYPLLLAAHSDVDPGPVAAGYLGVAVIGALFLAVGLFASTLSRNQIVAATIAFALMIVLFSAGLLEQLVPAGPARAVFAHMNLWQQMDDFARGVVDSRWIVYPLSLAGLFLFLAVRALEVRKWG